ncbi:hypothetical protein BY458DRAFT_499874 [Sporodiniella umbellata]|nr:hypothetical protein BY458DRAFT_499874 [Sporodiniella umbellata]
MPSELLYNQALKAFLLKKHSVAAKYCTKAIDTTQNDEEAKFRTWTLYMNIASALAENLTLHMTKQLGLDLKVADSANLCTAIWKRLGESYGTIADINILLLPSFVGLTCQLRQYDIGRSVIEEWFSYLSDAALDSISQKSEREDDNLVATYIRLVEIYTTCILPKLGEFDAAIVFLDYNTTLPEPVLNRFKKSVKESKESMEQKMKDLEQDKAAKLAVSENPENPENPEQIIEDSVEKAPEELLNDNNVKLKTEDSSLCYEASPPTKEVHNSIPENQLDFLKFLRTWINRMAIKSMLPYTTILLLTFSLAVLLKSQRVRFFHLLHSIFSKIYQTVRMGTTVTYM